MVPSHQITTQMNKGALVSPSKDTLDIWLDGYFDLQDQSAESSRKVKRQDIDLFLRYLQQAVGNINRLSWTPRQTRAFWDVLKTTPVSDLFPDGHYRGKTPYSPRTLNRILDHLKAFSRWIAKHQAFPLGEPTAGIKRFKKALRLDIEKGLSPQERNRLLDAADQLVATGGLSKDRARYPDQSERPQRKNYRPYRDRALLYTLIETGMRRAAATAIMLDKVDFERGQIETLEKGGDMHGYSISAQGLKAISDYQDQERAIDAEAWGQPGALFLTAPGSVNSDGTLKPRTVNDIWNKVCAAAQVNNKTPHSARHGMGNYIMEKTGNVSAVQQQLGHRNAMYSMEYARVTNKALKTMLDER